MDTSPVLTRNRGDGPSGPSRREFAAQGALALAWGSAVGSSVAAEPKRPIRLGLIADLHQDLVPDGSDRMRAFAQAMEKARPDAVIQLGDFAHPNEKNRATIERFRECCPVSLHVIGNHDTDASHTKDQCLKVWGMSHRYYRHDFAGLSLLVLDGNDRGSPQHKGGYPAYVGKEQTDWLSTQLSQGPGPFLLVSHQPLAGPGAVDNSAALQEILGAASSKILAAICGHTHIDHLVRLGNVPYLHLNSASYYWVGGAFAHASYPESVHKKFPAMANTCPYQDSLFAMLTIEPDGTLDLRGKSSSWLGKSPAQVGFGRDSSLTDGEEIAPLIRDRRLPRIQSPAKR